MQGQPARPRRWIKYATSSLLWAVFFTFAFGYGLGGFIANYLFDLGKPDAAIAVYRIALKIYPWNAPNRNGLGLTLLEYGDVDGAIVELQRAVTLAPALSKYHDHLGAALLRKGRIDEAIDQFKEANRLDPQNKESKRNLEKAISEKDDRGAKQAP